MTQEELNTKVLETLVNRTNAINTEVNGNWNTGFTYDEDGRLINIIKTGNSEKSYTYSYNEDDTLNTVTEIIGDTERVKSFTYEEGILTSVSEWT